MPDPRMTKLAQVLIHYSLELKPGQQLLLRATPLAEELALAAYAEAIKAGAHVLVQGTLPGAEEVFYKYASEAQLDFLPPVTRMVVETFDARLDIGGEYNTRELSGVDPQKIARFRQAYAPLSKIFMERSASGALRWCYTVYPTYASAQDADMSLSDYREFVFGAGLLNEPDPVALWREEGARQRRLINWLKGKDRVTLKGANLDLTLSIRGRAFVEADGKYNFPDGEIFTGPVEDSVNG